MIKLPLILFLCFIIFPKCLSGQIIFQDNFPFSDSSEIRLLYSEALKIWNRQDTLGYVVGRLDILETSNDKFLLPDGKSDVFKWLNNKWVNQYNGVHHGFNYQSKKFVWKDNIYSIGGYGFWTTNGLIIKFLQNSGEWEMLEFTQTLSGGGPYIKGDSIIVMQNGIQTIINLASEKISTGHMIPALAKVKYEGFYFYDCKNYAFAIEDIRILINKNNDSVLTSNIVIPFQQFTKGLGIWRSFIHFHDDDIKVYFNDGSTGKNENVEEEKQHFKPVQNLKYDSGRKYIFGAGSILIAISLGVFYYKKKYYQKKDDIDSLINNNFKNEFINKFKECNGKTITMSELDNLFGIDSIANSDYQKYQRMLMLKEVNTEYEHKMGRSLIIREKDPLDGRRYLYRVEF